VDIEILNQLNRDILIALQERGITAPSYSTLIDKYCIRVAIANHRSRYDGFDALIEESVWLGQALTN